ncbi:MAG: c-type cytochrome [Campylobacterota bacterium]|nr:c-type cytochrome [Campylobacterota bacterium]
MKTVILVMLALFLAACSEEATTTSPQKAMLKKISETTQSQEETPKEEVASVEEVKEEAVVLDKSTEITLDETTEVTSEVTATKSGATLFKVCSSCHGLSGEKKALNKSKVIQAWTQTQVIESLNGYKDGSYGGAMKGLMKSQVTKLSDEDIAALAKYISEL